MQTERLLPGEWQLHRDIRLRALQASPDSFGESHADVAARDEVYWLELTRSVTEPGRHVMFLAREGTRVVGTVYGLRVAQDVRLGRIGGMWVEPGSRRNGVGRALLQSVMGWAREVGFERMALWAPLHSEAAMALYRHAGFVETGVQEPLDSNPALRITAMEVVL